VKTNFLVEVVGAYSNKTRTLKEWRDLRERMKATVVTVPVAARPSRKATRQMQKRLEPTEVETFQTDYSAGISINELAERYQIHRETVFQQIDRLGLPRRYPRLRPTDVLAAVSMYQAGRSLAIIGAHFGVAPHTVGKALVKAGLTLRPRPGH
jgi:transposase